MYQKMSKKGMCLNYKQYKLSLLENCDMSRQIMTVGVQCPKFSELMASPLEKYITIAANNCGYGGATEDLIVNYIHCLFLKAK